MLFPPPKRLAIPAMSPPSPAILPSPPPLNVLATPPEAVCLRRLAHSLPLCAEVVALLDGDPKLMPVGRVFEFMPEIFVSPALLGLIVFSAAPCGCVITLVGASSLLRLCPFIFWLPSCVKRPDKLFLLFATLYLHLPRLFKHYDCIGRLGIHVPQAASSTLFPISKLIE